MPKNKSKRNPAKKKPALPGASMGVKPKTELQLLQELLVELENHEVEKVIDMYDKEMQAKLNKENN